MDEKTNWTALRDSWQNLLTGLGTLWDKGRWTVPRSAHFMDPETLEALFHGDPYARRVVEDPVRAAMRQGYDLISSGMWDQGSRRAGSWTWYEPDPEQSKREALDIRQKLDAIGADDALMQLFVFGRLFGRQAVLIGADDGQSNLAKPLDEEKVKDVRYLEVIDCRDFYVSSYQTDPTKPGYGDPEVWRITRASGTVSNTGQVLVHQSRLLMAGGALTSRRKRMENNWRDASVLDAAQGELQRFNTDSMSMSSMLMDCSQAVLKMTDFARMLAGGEKDTLKDRMDIIDRGRSISRIMPIDKDGEEFSYVDRSFAGVKDVFEKRQQLLSGAYGWPMVVLFGREPAGLSSTGEADIRGWYDTIHAARETQYRPTIERLVRLIARACDVEQPESWGISWPSLWQESPKERAERQKLTADTDNTYIMNGVLDPSEVSTARYGSGEWSDQAPQLDTESRERVRELETAPPPEPGDEEELYGETLPDMPQPEEAVDPRTALNGAQVKAMVEVVQSTALGQLPRETAVEILAASFPISREEADLILGEVGRGFKMAKEEETTE